MIRVYKSEDGDFVVLTSSDAGTQLVASKEEWHNFQIAIRSGEYDYSQLKEI